MNIPDFNNIKSNQLSEKYIKEHYPEFYHYLKEKYKYVNYYIFSELIYLFLHRLDDIPKCKCCNNKVKFKHFAAGYRIYCSAKCQTNDIDYKNRLKQTNLKKYGVENPFQSEIIKEKIKKTNLEKYGAKYPIQTLIGKNKVQNTIKERYGVDHPMKSDVVKERSKKTCLKRYGVDHPMKSDVVKEKEKQTNLKKYGVENPSQLDDIKEKIKQTNLKKYGVCCSLLNDNIIEKTKQTNLKKYGEISYNKTEEFKRKILNKVSESNEKRYQTKKQNHSFNASKIEQDFKKWLDDNNIEYKYQYKSDDYPFSCDFYFPNKDLYLEIQAGWTHGHHPFNPNNEEDIRILEIMKSKNTKYYDNVIYNWTVRDVNKRNIAKENGINLIEAFTNNIEELINIYEHS